MGRGQKPPAGLLGTRPGLGDRDSPPPAPAAQGKGCRGKVGARGGGSKVGGKEGAKRRGEKRGARGVKQKGGTGRHGKKGGGSGQS